MKKQKGYIISIFVIVCILINYINKTLTGIFKLPFWLDSVGTVFAAYALGPICGAIVGAASNIIYSMRVTPSIYYVITNVLVGVIIGIVAKKGIMKDLFTAMTTAFVIAIMSVVVSAPINYILMDGSTGNIWGDGIIELLCEIGCNRLISCIIGEFYLDFLDKMMTILILFISVRIYQKRKKNSSFFHFLMILFSLCVLTPSEPIYAEEEQNYVMTVYDGENGLPGGTASDIVQTKDGVLWVGTYGGLYRYSGSTFQWMNNLESVKTVNCLYTDEEGRLWIGTNDNGLSICINQDISNVLNQDNGLPSDSVRCITKSSEGYYYIGTTSSLVVMTLSGGLSIYETIPEIVYAESISADKNRNIATVTNEGRLYLITDTMIIAQKELSDDGNSYTCCAFGDNGTLYVGTSSNVIEVYDVSNGSLDRITTVKCGNLIGINSLNFADDDRMYICADNGAGYILNGRYNTINTSKFNSSIDHMVVDYQGNLWFTSSRLGLLCLCKSVFTEISANLGMPESVVNTVTEWNGKLYIGTDNGLTVIDQAKTKQYSDPLTQMLKDARIRCLMVDSKNHLWIGTSNKGVLEIDEGGQVLTYDSSNGALGEKFRTMIETRNGEIVIAGDSGLTFVKNGEVYNTIGTGEGLTNPKVLTLYEQNDGCILAGTDGNGIAVIDKDSVVETWERKDGLSSEVVLRIIPDSDGSGLFIVTGNGLCYAEGKTIKCLNNFPYYNNFDLVEGNNGELFVLSSAGIYVVDKDKLLEGDELDYVLLNKRKGLRIELTPNAWNYVDSESNLYLSGGTGVVSFNLEQYENRIRSYRMMLKSIIVDDENYAVEKGEPTIIPRGAQTVEIVPEIVNYSTNEPNVSVYLEGFDKEPRTVLQSELTGSLYINLPAGEFTYHLAVLDSRTNEIIAENTYKIIKEKEIYDNWWFKLYAGVVFAIAIAYLTWMFAKTQIQKTLRLQRVELELARNQLQMGNETILTIAKTVDAKDENTSQHSVRVSEYSVMIARRIGYSDEECENLRKIALLHDIGKIGIPDRVLNKPDRLTDEEYEVMKSHVTRGAEILKNFTLIDNVTEGALYHHERYDGRGYVHGLKGEEIPLNARIIGIADAFDAMTANRVYRKKLEINQVLDELKKGKGMQFDPKLVDILLSLIEDGTIDINRIYDSKNSEELKGEN